MSGGRRRPGAFAKAIARSIRGSLGRYLAIVGIVALGSGFYAGLKMCGPDMRSAADELYDGTNLYDIRVVSTMGFSASDVGRVEQTDGAAGVMAAVSADVMARLGTEQGAVRVSSLDVDAARAGREAGASVILSDDGNYLNRVFLREGTWPKVPDECVVTADKAVGGIGVGDTIEVLYGTTDLDDLLKGRSFEVVGTVSSPNYPYTGSFGSTTLGSGMIADYLYVLPEAFADDVPFTEIYLRVDGAEALESGSDEYVRAVGAVRGRLEGSAGELAQARLGDVRRKAQEELDGERAKAQDELASAKSELDEARERLDQGEKDYEEGLADYESGREEAESRLAAAEAAIASGQRELDAAKAQLQSAEQSVPAQVAGFLGTLAERGVRASDLASARTQLEGSRKRLQGALVALDALDAARAKVSDLEGSASRCAEQLVGLGSPGDWEEREARLAGLLEAGRQALEEAEAAAQDGQGWGWPSPAGSPALAEAQARVADLRRQLEDARTSAERARSLEELGQRLAGELEDARQRLGEAEGGAAGLPSADEVRQQAAQMDEALLGLAQLESAQAQLAQGRAQIEAGERQLADARSQVASQREAAARELASARSKLDDARRELDEGAAEYESGLAEWRQAKADAEAELGKAQRQIDELEAPDIYVLDREQSEGAATYDADTHRMDSIANVFPLIFFLVAALVALTTMTRMVDDDRVEIGTYKALGYSTSRIAGKYLAYAGSASLAGAVVGILSLSQLLPYVVTSAYSIIYTVPLRVGTQPLDVGVALASGGLGVGVTLLATWAAVVANLREVPATLMLPRAPAAGKRILLERVGPVWRRLSFSWKVTCRNLFRYKRRLAMTVVGISGCTALLLVGFGLHDAIWDIIDNQYGPILHYDTTVSLTSDASASDVEEVQDFLLGTGDVRDAIRVQRENMQVGTEAGGDTSRVQVYVPRTPDELCQAVTFRERLSGAPVAFDDASVILTEKLADRYGLAVGDTVLAFDQDAIGNAVGGGYPLVVTGVTENYVGDVMYVGREAWRAVDRMRPVFNTILATTTDSPEARDAIAEELHGRDNVSTVMFSAEVIGVYRNMLSVVDMIVVVLTVSAGLLAFIVLYNLTNINIGERMREIASLKVLGFTRREVYAYIYREIALMAVLGDALGMVLGTFLATFVITTAEVDYVMFGRSIHPLSYVWSFALALAFTALILMLMRHKLDRVDMVESLKSVD